MRHVKMTKYKSIVWGFQGVCLMGWSMIYSTKKSEAAPADYASYFFLLHYSNKIRVNLCARNYCFDELCDFKFDVIA